MSILTRLRGRRCAVCGERTRHLLAHVWLDHSEVPR